MGLEIKEANMQFIQNKSVAIITSPPAHQKKKKKIPGLTIIGFKSLTRSWIKKKKKKSTPVPGQI